MTVIQLKGVTKVYPGNEEPAVRELDLGLGKGEIVTLLGPSGCGKTTTLRLIAGFEQPDSGEIYLGGRKVAAPGCWVPPEKRGIGMVFQDHALFPHLTVAANIGFGLERDPRRREKVAGALKLVDLTGLEGRLPGELSGGQRQRVALARALVREPLVVLLDEPFSSLDAGLREQMRWEVSQIIKEARATALFVTHDQREALSISDRIIVLRQGMVEQGGTPQEVYCHPETEFVANFVGSANLLPGRIAPGGGEVETDIGLIPCQHDHGLGPGEKVTLSVRPDSFELDPQGGVTGRVTRCVYTGSALEALVEAGTSSGKTRTLLVHIQPEEQVAAGSVVSFRVLPHFVAVIGKAN